jgi:hypothetical protein
MASGKKHCVGATCEKRSVAEPAACVAHEGPEMRLTEVACMSVPNVSCLWTLLYHVDENDAS